MLYNTTIIFCTFRIPISLVENETKEGQVENRNNDIIRIFMIQGFAAAWGLMASLKFGTLWDFRYRT